MDNLDKAIEAKQIEMKNLTDAMAANTIVHERNPGEPLVMHSSDDLIKYSILSKSRDIAEIEHSVLLDQKSSDGSHVDTSQAEKEIAALKLEIEKMEQELEA